jgi:phosphoserine phosphatase RsbU/P
MNNKMQPAPLGPGTGKIGRHYGEELPEALAMTPAPLPFDEAERLAELRALEILDTPAEARFDRIVQLAARVFQTPIAYIAMMDANRQWIKAGCGFEASESDRKTSFCSHTILQDTPLVVKDTLLDDRFRYSPLVVDEPYIRFYAGHPLSGPGGRHVGTLCLADRVPRTLDDAQLEILAHLAAMVERELGMVSLIRTQRELLETKTELITAQDRLAHELAEAAAYVKSLLPARLEGSIRTDWQFVSSSALGGDFFGYRWLNDHSLAIYLLDVMGHGVGAALLSTSIESALRGRLLGSLAFDHPAAVMGALNDAFPMDQNDGRFFSMWYGVYHRGERMLEYANAGHPPPLMFNGSRVSRLGGTGTMVGIAPGSRFASKRVSVAHNARLYLYSDGAYEVATPPGGMLMLEGLQEIIARVTTIDGPHTAEILRLIRAAHGQTEFKDDVSLLEIVFD